jgi:hypothetical protein
MKSALTLQAFPLLHILTITEVTILISDKLKHFVAPRPQLRGGDAYA